MISGVTNPSTLAELQSRQKTDPTVSVSQATPLPDPKTNTAANGPQEGASTPQSPSPDRVTLSREGLDAGSSGRNNSTEGVPNTENSPGESVTSPGPGPAPKPEVQSAGDKKQDQAIDYAKLQIKSVQMQQLNAPTLGVPNVGSILNLVA